MNFHVNLRIYYYTALSASTKKNRRENSNKPHSISLKRVLEYEKKKTQLQSKSKISLIYHVKK